MAPSSSPSFLLLLLFLSLGRHSAMGAVSLTDRSPMTSSGLSEPHFTECISREEVTFRCRWSTGSFHNLSQPGALRVFYLKKESPTSEWKECPDYIPSEKECFFDRNHTSIWVTYCMQLRTHSNITYGDDDDCFKVENIVRPDPPVDLNWTLLSVSPSGLRYDIITSWEPPPSADVGIGWMTLEYEFQYRENGTDWKKFEVQVGSSLQSVYGLHTGKEYEVRVRCRMAAFTKYGEFSDSIFVHVAEIPSKDSSFPFTLVLIFGIVGVVILLMLIIFSQQNRLMVILLPPVPAPKIKGIDPELLKGRDVEEEERPSLIPQEMHWTWTSHSKKGKLEELSFILRGGGVGGLSSYPPDLYQDDPWVEFIEVNAEEADPGEREETHNSDTQRLLGGVAQHPSHHHMHLGCSHTLSLPDASCYDPDVPVQETLMLMAALLPGQSEGGEVSLDSPDRSPGAPEGGDRPLGHTQHGGPHTWLNTDFYAQVSDVTPSGGVVLSPGQQPRTQESTPATEEETKRKNKKEGIHEDGGEGTEAEVERRRKELQFQLLVVDPEGDGYTTESTARQISTPPSAPLPGEGYQTVPPQSAETKPQQETFVCPPVSAGEYQPPYIIPDSPPAQFLPPVSDYTVVQEVDYQHSLLLNPPSPQSPPPCLPQQPPKPLPAMPMGYLSPDLLGNLSP